MQVSGSIKTSPIKSPVHCNDLLFGTISMQTKNWQGFDALQMTLCILWLVFRVGGDIAYAQTSLNPAPVSNLYDEQNDSDTIRKTEQGGNGDVQSVDEENKNDKNGRNSDMKESSVSQEELVFDCPHEIQDVPEDNLALYGTPVYQTVSLLFFTLSGIQFDGTNNIWKSLKLTHWGDRSPYFVLWQYNPRPEFAHWKI